jgi:hypothetical protein
MGLVQHSKISGRLIGMGDSHLDNFTFFCAATCRIPGATAYSLTNLKSETHAGDAFYHFLSVFPPFYIPLLCIGEVDCNSLPWRKVTNEKPTYFIHQSVSRLFSFIKETKRKFILPSVTLPPVDSYKEQGVRLHVTSNQQERTELVVLYNKVLKEVADKLGHHFLDITTPTTGLDGLVDQSFIRSNSDVHLSPTKLYLIIRDLLDKVDYV